MLVTMLLVGLFWCFFLIFDVVNTGHQISSRAYEQIYLCPKGKYLKLWLAAPVLARGQIHGGPTKAVSS